MPIKERFINLSLADSSNPLPHLQPPPKVPEEGRLPLDEITELLRGGRSRRTGAVAAFILRDRLGHEALEVDLVLSAEGFQLSGRGGRTCSGDGLHPGGPRPRRVELLLAPALRQPGPALTPQFIRALAAAARCFTPEAAVMYSEFLAMVGVWLVSDRASINLPISSSRPVAATVVASAASAILTV
jgi:hypothetical protein